jgi:uncharacterized membrane protein (DUF485 family)
MSELAAPERGSNGAPDRDWTTIARSPEFQRLLASRRRVVIGGTAFYTAYFVGFLLLLAFAKSALDDTVVGSISIAMLLAASLVLMTFVMAYVYAAKANSEWNALVEEAARAASPVGEPAPVASVPVAEREVV